MEDKPVSERRLLEILEYVFENKFKSIDKRFESIDKQLNTMNTQLHSVINYYKIKSNHYESIQLQKK